MKPAYPWCALLLLCGYHSSHAEPVTFFLELIVNGRNSGVIAEAIHQNDQWLIRRDDLIAAGVNADMMEDDTLLLQQGTDPYWEYDQANQRLEITLPADFFRHSNCCREFIQVLLLMRAAIPACCSIILFIPLVVTAV